MGTSYEEFIRDRIETRRNVFEERKQMLTWEVDSRVPFYILEKLEEIKINALLGLDHNIMKLISSFVEYVLLQLNVTIDIKSSGDTYNNVLKKAEGRGLKALLDHLTDNKAIGDEDIKFCTQFLTVNMGGQNIRNEEAHNKEVSKVERFEPALESGEPLDDFAKQFLKDFISQNPGPMQIASRVQNEVNVLSMMAGVHDLINRNSSSLGFLK